MSLGCHDRCASRPFIPGDRHHDLSPTLSRRSPSARSPGLIAAPHFGRSAVRPSHGWAEEHGAVFIEVGPWLRAQYFPRPGETDWLATVSREVPSVRGSVGFCDVSTLGKIDLQGPDAGEFLDRLYINAFSTLRSDVSATA